MKWLSMLLIGLFAYSVMADVVVDGRSTAVSTTPGTIQDFSQVAEFLVPTNPTAPQSAVSLDYFLNHSGGVTTNWIDLQGYAYSNFLSRTTYGAEGMRQIGALGGYTLDEYFEDTALRGAARDAPVFIHAMAPSNSLDISWTSGDVYDPTSGYYHIIDDADRLYDNTINYAYWSRAAPQDIWWTTGTRPNVSNTILLAEFSTAFGMIVHSGDVVPVGDLPLKLDAGLSAVFPSLIVSGIQYMPIGTNLNQIMMTGGTEYHDLSQANIHAAKNLTNYGFVPPQTFLITYHHTNSASWGWSTTNSLPVDQWDNGTNLVACTASNWYRGVFVSMAENPSMHYVYPTAEFTNYNDAFAATDPTLPSGFDPYIPISTAYIYQGGDTTLRTDGMYWLDRRFMIRRGAIVSGGGGSGGTIPTLYQVLLQGADGGGIFPTVSGIPASGPQLVNKQYVDQSVNNINFGKVYVDRNGSDITGAIRDSIHPFKTIQAAIDAAVLVANDTNRFVVCVSPGIYNENVTMHNYIGIQALDIEATVVNGAVTYPPAFTDAVGSEIQMLTISASNTPALVLSAGADTAYMGIRSCYVRSTYDNDVTNKTVLSMARGIVEVYGTTYMELNVLPTNGSESVCHSQIFEYTDPTSTGLIIFNSFSSSMTITSEDANDDISAVYTHDTTFKGIDAVQGGIVRIILEGAGLSYSNNIKLVSNERSSARVGYDGVFTSIKLPLTNTCNVFCGYSKDGKVTGSAIAYKDNRTGFTAGTPAAIWWGAATTTNDTVLAVNNIIMPLVNGTNYPQVYTNDGSAGNVRYVTAMADGNLVVSGKAYAYGGFVGDGSGLTNLPLQPDTFALWRVGTGLVAGAESFSDNPANAVVMGFSATGTMKSVVLGYQAKGLANSVAIGDKAVATDGGVAVGGEARGDRFGFAMGPYANGTNFGVAVGNAAVGRIEGVAIGNSAHGEYYGVGIGVNSSGDNYGTAIGHEADGQNTNVAIGYNAKIQFPIRNTIAIGAGTVASNSLYGGYTHFWGVPVISKAGQISATNIIGTPAVYWLGSFGSGMDLAFNWLGGVAPTARDVAIFDKVLFPDGSSPNGGINNAHLSILRGNMAIHGGTFNGDVVTYDNSYLGGGTFNGNVVMHNTSFNAGATIKGTTTFLDSSYDGPGGPYKSLRLVNGKWLWPNAANFLDLSNNTVNASTVAVVTNRVTEIWPLDPTGIIKFRSSSGTTNMTIASNGTPTFANTIISLQGIVAGQTLSSQGFYTGTSGRGALLAQSPIATNAVSFLWTSGTASVAGGLINIVVGGQTNLYLTTSSTVIPSSLTVLGQTWHSNAVDFGGFDATNIGTVAVVTGRVRTALSVGSGTNTAGALFAINYRNTDGQTGTLATAGIVWGDGDTGIYEALDDQLVIRQAGSGYWVLANDRTLRGLSAGSEIADISPSTTLAMFRRSSDSGTGYGFDGNTKSLALISGGAMRLQITNNMATFNLPVTMTNNLTVLGTINATNMPTGSGRMFMGENGPTSILYHVTSGGHTNKVGEFWTP